MPAGKDGVSPDVVKTRRTKWILAIAALGASAALQDAAADSVVVFNEIMYHPSTNEAALEWIELHNEMAYDMDISGWKIRGGVDYDFTNGTIVPGRGFLVVAASPAQLAAVTGCTNALGPFSGQLSNAGEEIRLINNSDRLMNSVNYGDSGDWPVEADGSGVTLAKVEPDAGNGHGNWSHSLQINGTPGASNFPSMTRAAKTLVFNEIQATTNASWWIELRNIGASALNPSGCVATVANDPLRKYVVTNQSLGAGALLYLPQSKLGFRASIDGEPVFLFGPGKTNVLDARRATATLRGRTPEPDGRWPRVFNFKHDALLKRSSSHVTKTSAFIPSA